MSETNNFQEFEKIHEEQLPVPKHKLHGWTHFAGLYAFDNDVFIQGRFSWKRYQNSGNDHC